MIELAVLAAFAAVICWGFGDFLIQKSVRRIGDIESLLFIGLIGIVILFPLALNDIGLLLEPQNLALIVLLGLATFIAAMLDLEALKQGKLSVIEVILEIELPITILFGIVFFKEFLTPLQLFVIILAFFGVVLMAVKKRHLKNIPKMFEKGVILGVFGAVAMGLINFLTAASSRQISPAMAIWGPYVVFSILCIFLIWKGHAFKKLELDWKKFSKPIIAMGVIDTLTWFFFAIAVFEGELGIITAITESYPAIGLFLGVYINKERIEKHQAFGAILALAASIALAMLL